MISVSDGNVVFILILLASIVIPRAIYTYIEVFRGVDDIIERGERMNKWLDHIADIGQTTINALSNKLFSNDSDDGDGDKICFDEEENERLSKR